MVEDLCKIFNDLRNIRGGERQCSYLGILCQKDGDMKVFTHMKDEDKDTSGINTRWERRSIIRLAEAAFASERKNLKGKGERVEMIRCAIGGSDDEDS